MTLRQIENNIFVQIGQELILKHTTKDGHTKRTPVEVIDFTRHLITVNTGKYNISLSKVDIWLKGGIQNGTITV